MVFSGTRIRSDYRACSSALSRLRFLRLRLRANAALSVEYRAEVTLDFTSTLKQSKDDGKDDHRDEIRHVRSWRPAAPADIPAMDPAWSDSRV